MLITKCFKPYIGRHNQLKIALKRSRCYFHAKLFDYDACCLCGQGTLAGGRYSWTKSLGFQCATQHQKCQQKTDNGDQKRPWQGDRVSVWHKCVFQHTVAASTGRRCLHSAALGSWRSDGPQNENDNVWITEYSGLRTTCLERSATDFACIIPRTWTVPEQT